MMWIALIVCIHLVRALIPYGTSDGDTLMDKAVPAIVNLQQSFPFYGSSYTIITIQKDGFVVFGDTSLKTDADLMDVNNVLFPAIGPWVASVEFGNIFYRLTSDSRVFNNLTDISKNFQDLSSSFIPSYALVVTWSEIGTVHFGTDGDAKDNIVQMVLVTDGVKSLAIFEYNKIEWVYYEGQSAYDYNNDDIYQFPENIEINTKVGFFKGDGPTHYMLPLSKKAQLFQIDDNSNIDIRGTYAFRIDTAPVNVTAVPATTTTEPTTSQTTSTTTTSATTTTYTTTRTTRASTARPTTTTTPPYVPGYCFYRCYHLVWNYRCYWRRFFILQCRPFNTQVRLRSLYCHQWYWPASRN